MRLARPIAAAVTLAILAACAGRSEPELRADIGITHAHLVGTWLGNATLDGQPGTQVARLTVTKNDLQLLARLRLPESQCPLGVDGHLEGAGDRVRFVSDVVTLDGSASGGGPLEGTYRFVDESLTCFGDTGSMYLEKLALARTVTISELRADGLLLIVRESHTSHR